MVVTPSTGLESVGKEWYESWLPVGLVNTTRTITVWAVRVT